MRALNSRLSTKVGSPTRKRRRRTLAIFVALAAWTTGASAAPALYPRSPSPDVAIVPRLAPDGRLHLDVTGLWPTPCLPSGVDVGEAAGELRLEARANRGLCRPMTMPFRFDIDVAARLGHALLPGDYRISFHAANGAAAPLELRGFTVVGIAGATIVPESGYWWPQSSDENHDNQGIALNIENQGEQIAVGVLTFAADGSPTWFFGTGPRSARSASLDAVAMRQGPDLFGNTRRMSYPDERIHVELAFASAGRLTAWFGRYEPGSDQPTLRLREVAFARMPLVNADGAETWQGDWLLTPTVAEAEASMRRLHLESPQRLDAEHFRLGAGNTNLTCRVATEHAAAPPADCTLNDPVLGEIHFGSVGIDRMDGTDRLGNPVSLQRLR